MAAEPTCVASVMPGHLAGAAARDGSRLPGHESSGRTAPTSHPSSSASGFASRLPLARSRLRGRPRCRLACDVSSAPGPYPRDRRLLRQRARLLPAGNGRALRCRLAARHRPSPARPPAGRRRPRAVRQRPPLRGLVVHERRARTSASSGCWRWRVSRWIRGCEAEPTTTGPPTWRIACPDRVPRLDGC